MSKLLDAAVFISFGLFAISLALRLDGLALFIIGGLVAHLWFRELQGPS